MTGEHEDLERQELAGRYLSGEEKRTYVDRYYLLASVFFFALLLFVILLLFVTA